MKEIGCLIVGSALLVILGVGAFFGGVSFVYEALSLPTSLVKIEQLRTDSRFTTNQNSEDVVGQIVEWNQAIRSKQVQNDQWWSGWYIPDEWDSVELIPVPTE